MGTRHGHALRRERARALALAGALLSAAACGDVAPADAGVDAAVELGTPDLGMPDLGTPDLGAPDLEANDLATSDGSTDVDATDLDATDLGAADLDATDLDATDLDATDLDAADLGATDLGADAAACTPACPWACTSAGCDDLVSVAVGNNHSCAVRASGVVDCWGQNSSGQLGDGTTAMRSLPTGVVGVTDATQAAAGFTHTCALRRGGTVTCWGENTLFELGDAAPARRAPTTDVPGVSDVVQIAAAESHTCALDGAGAVTCWGNGAPPAVVPSLPPLSAVDCGSTMDCGLRAADSVVVCWGRGALGDGTYYATASGPVVVGGATPLVATDLGVGTITTCAVDDAGHVWCWGSNLNGMLGDGVATHAGGCGGVDCSLVPVEVSGITTAVNVALGWHTGCARLGDGRMDCWGFNGAWCLGSGGPMTMVTDVPLEVPGLTDTSSVVSKDLHFCAARASGGVTCWGLNLHGELGDGTLATRTTPVDVVPP